MFIYKPTQEAIEQPRMTLLDGSWVGIGGDFTTSPTPPRIPTTYKEATNKQYKRLFMTGRFSHLIQKVKQADVQTDEPDTQVSG